MELSSRFSATLALSVWCLVLSSPLLFGGESVDLRPNFAKWGLGPKAQGDRSTCSVCVTTSAFEYALSRRHGRGMPLSVEYLNWASNQVIGNTTADRGQFFHDLLAGFEKYGLCPEALMPYEPSFANTQPSSETRREAEAAKALGFKVHWLKRWSKEGDLTDETFNLIKGLLRKGWPVGLGSDHSRLAVGFEDDPNVAGGGNIIVADSGGAGSFRKDTYEFVKSKTYDVFWVELPKTPPQQ